MPGAKLPDDPATPAPADWYSPEELDVFRLSSKSHWDVPIDVGKKTVHFLVSHPTPPVFDGAEDRNGTRNFDEIRLWADYVRGGTQAAYIYDDEGRYGGLRSGAQFVIAGDQNSDPLDGDSVPGAIQQLLDNPKVNATRPADQQGRRRGLRAPGRQRDPREPGEVRHRRLRRARTPGNLRADYVLPSRDLKIEDSAVFWPVQADPLFRLTGVFPFPSSDHRLVWVDVSRPPPPLTAVSVAAP